MNKFCFVASLLIIGGGNCFSANDIKVGKLLKSNSVIVNEPIRIDSVNLKKNRFEEKDLLNYSFIPNKDSFTEIEADTTGYFTSEKTENKSSFSVYKFYIRSDRYSKATVEVKSPDMLQLFVEGKKIGEKTTLEDSLSLAGKVSGEITFEPGQKEVSVKYLSLSKSKCPPALKIDVIASKNDSAAQFETSINETHPLTIEYQMTGKRISGMSLSPDGKYAYINYTTVLPDGSKIYNKPLLRLSDNAEIYELSNKDNLMWMPVSKALSYTRKGMNGKELVAFYPETMSEKVLVNNLPEGYFYWSPDEKFLCFTTSEEFPGQKKDVYQVMTPDDRQPGWRNRYNISKFDIEKGVLEQVTFGFHNVYIHDISGDCKKVIFSESFENITERPFSLTSIYELDLESYKVDTLWNKHKFINRVSYSPDNSKLLIIGTGESFDGIGNNIKDGQISNLFDTQAFIFDREKKSIDPITKDFNPAIDRANWYKGDNKIYFTCTDKDYENVYSYDIKGRKFEKLPLNVDVVSGFDIADNAPTAIYFGQSVSYPEQAFKYELKTKKSMLVSDPQKEQVGKYELGEVKDWSFVSTDGTTIDGRYYLPANFDPNKKYPMIVYYYGGTSTTARSFFHPYSMHLYAAQGYVVYTLQPSGTTGYGQEFSARHVNAWGIQTADDIICGVKQFCKEHSFVNEKKIGCMGASYGGFMTMYLQTRTDIFAAAVSHAGISALSSYWGEGYWGYSYSGAASANSYPWNNPKLYTEQSPLFSADKINTPILLLHGTADTNVPTGESIQMFTALKLLGKQVDFVLVNGENHGISEFNKRLAWKKSIFAFFAKWLKDEPQWWETLYPKSVIE